MAIHRRIFNLRFPHGESMNFADSLGIGQLGESIIARWLRRRGWNILPAYEKEIGSGKGPRLFMATGSPHDELITPDLLAMCDKRFYWIEAKHKSVFSWYGIGSYWTTGVDRRHFYDYVRVQKETGITVWLMFLHRESQPRREDKERWPDCPDTCPTGLFGQRLGKLVYTKSHESNRHGATGMVYWGENALKRLATLDEVMSTTPPLAQEA